MRTLLFNICFILNVQPMIKIYLVGLTAAEQTRVLLVTAHRSGSTFLGELFNRNPNAFYIFEPLASG